MDAADGRLMGAPDAPRWAPDGHKMKKRQILDTLRVDQGSPPPRSHEMTLETISGADFPIQSHHVSSLIDL